MSQSLMVTIGKTGNELVYALGWDSYLILIGSHIAHKLYIWYRKYNPLCLTLYCTFRWKILWKCVKFGICDKTLAWSLFRELERHIFIYILELIWSFDLYLLWIWYSIQQRWRPKFKCYYRRITRLYWQSLFSIKTFSWPIFFYLKVHLHCGHIYGLIYI